MKNKFQIKESLNESIFASDNCYIQILTKQGVL